MQSFELKTPLKVARRYANSKKRADKLRVEEFMAYETSNYFSQFGCNDIEISTNTFVGGIETNVEKWLLSKGICKATVSEKKESYFEERRERVNSFSYFDNTADTDSLECNSSVRNLTPVSLEFTPQNSKLGVKRSNFSCYLDLEIRSGKEGAPDFSSSYKDTINDYKFSNFEFKEEDVEQMSALSPYRASIRLKLSKFSD